MSVNKWNVNTLVGFLACALKILCKTLQQSGFLPENFFVSAYAPFCLIFFTKCIWVKRKHSRL